MSAIAAALSRERPLLLDGGLGSLLIAAGLPGGAAPETWLVERPDAVTAAHRAYADAGCDALLTCTFGGHPLRLARFGLEERCEELAARAVRLARASGTRFVIGDVGPTGEYLPPVGRGDALRFRAGFARLGAALAAHGVDALMVETMSDRREAELAVAALRDVAPGLPVFASLTFERRPRGFFSVMGDALVPSLRALAELGATAVGANCTLASADMLELARVARAGVEAPLVIQPNAGQPVLSGDALRYTQEPREFARDMAEIAALGIEAVGGCCGTDSRFIAALAALLGRGPRAAATT